MQKLEMQDPNALSTKATTPLAVESFFEDSHISDIENFITTLSTIKTKEAKPDLIGSIITHYASKWLPELGDGEKSKPTVSTNSDESPKSATATWMKKRFFIEGIIGILPPEKESFPCDFLLRLLRAASMAGVGPAYLEVLEKRVSCQLDESSLKELLIPSFNHNCSTLLDVELVFRLVTMFVSCEKVCTSGGGRLVKVGKLVDCYLAEAAVDLHLKLGEFVALATAVPSHARCTDDRLYRAIDTYLKAHPGLSKQERKRLCNLIDSRKLSTEACYHAAQNERLPVRAVIQVLLSEQNKLYEHIDRSGSLITGGLDYPGRCNSKRGMSVQEIEIQRLKEDVLKLQSQCMNMEMVIQRLLDQKKKGFFGWKKTGIPGLIKKNYHKLGGQVERETEGGGGLRTPLEMKQRLVRGRNSSKGRKSSS